MYILSLPPFLELKHHSRLESDICLKYLVILSLLRSSQFYFFLHNNYKLTNTFFIKINCFFIFRCLILWDELKNRWFDSTHSVQNLTSSGVQIEIYFYLSLFFISFFILALNLKTVRALKKCLDKFMDLLNKAHEK